MRAICPDSANECGNNVPASDDSLDDDRPRLPGCANDQDVHNESLVCGSPFWFGYVQRVDATTAPTFRTALRELASA